jgi:hypothetical protein
MLVMAVVQAVESDILNVEHPLSKDGQTLRSVSPAIIRLCRLEGLAGSADPPPFGDHNVYSVCPCKADGTRIDDTTLLPCLSLDEIWRFNRYGQVPPDLTVVDPDSFDVSNPDRRPIVLVFESYYENDIVFYFLGRYIPEGTQTGDLLVWDDALKYYAIVPWEDSPYKVLMIDSDSPSAGVKWAWPQLRGDVV